MNLNNRFFQLPDSAGMSYYGHNLPPYIHPSQISQVLGFQAVINKDPKCEFQWVVAWDEMGIYFTIYDYNGEKWHIGSDTYENSLAVYQELMTILY